MIIYDTYIINLDYINDYADNDTADNDGISILKLFLMHKKYALL